MDDGRTDIRPAGCRRREGGGNPSLAWFRQGGAERCAGVQLSAPSPLGQHRYGPDGVLREALHRLAWRYGFHPQRLFVGGDNVLYSQDSRYWGLLPEEYIVGRAIRIWKSVDKDTDEFRWERWMKKIE